MATLNIVADSPDWRARLLSNFAATPFVLGGQSFASVEGFIQGIKFPPVDARRKRTFALAGMDAKKMGRIAAREYGYDYHKRIYVWWDGEAIDYGSVSHHVVICQAIVAKVIQIPEVRRALLATAGLDLVHDRGHPESARTSFPAAVFTDFLTALREGQIQLQRRS